MNHSITHNQDLDFEILLHLSDPDLIQACRINTYFNSICRQDRIWVERSKLYLGDEYIQAKPDDLSWRQWYFLWRNNRDDPIGSTLGLDLIQRGIRLYSKNGVMKGSELYQDIDTCLSRSFEKKNHPLISYFLDLYQRIKVKEGSPDSIMNFDLVVASAIRNGFLDQADILIRDMKQDRGTKSYRLTVRAFGSIGQVDLYRSYFFRPDEKDSLVLGLIEGGYTSMAIDVMSRDVKFFLDKNVYHEVIKEGIRRDNWDVIEHLNNELPLDDGKRNPYLISFALAAIEAGHPELAQDYEDLISPLQIAAALAEYDSVLALDYLEDNPIGSTVDGKAIKTSDYHLIKYCQDHEIKVEVNFTMVDLETLIVYLQKNKLRGGYLIDQVITNHRYALVPILDYMLDHPDDFTIGSHDDVNFLWDEICGGLPDGPKDLLLYVLTRALTQSSDDHRKSAIGRSKIRKSENLQLVFEAFKASDNPPMEGLSILESIFQD